MISSAKFIFLFVWGVILTIRIVMFLMDPNTWADGEGSHQTILATRAVCTVIEVILLLIFTAHAFGSF